MELRGLKSWALHGHGLAMSCNLLVKLVRFTALVIVSHMICSAQIRSKVDLSSADSNQRTPLDDALEVGIGWDCLGLVGIGIT